MIREPHCIYVLEFVRGSTSDSIFRLATIYITHPLDDRGLLLNRNLKC